MKSVENIKPIQLFHISIDRNSRNKRQNESITRNYSLPKQTYHHYKISFNNQRHTQNNQFPSISSQIKRNTNSDDRIPLFSLCKSKSNYAVILPIKKSITESNSFFPINNCLSIKEWLYKRPVYNMNNRNKNEINFYSPSKLSCQISKREQVSYWNMINREIISTPKHQDEQQHQYQQRLKLNNYFSLKKINKKFKFFKGILNMSSSKNVNYPLNQNKQRKNIKMKNRISFSPTLFKNKSVNDAIARTLCCKVKIITL